ncbi:hypothetical protein AQUCO_00300166v1 [Aquilegia coerulea]|uniref:Methyltransferase n=1 Tax=Aquilegia coerulea TaxID=218851 RepID=A0A2G5EXN7_AQUCA|nr:hypothetical protein AQUCO_00300166v1 [Aquilegia coerulea]
MKKSFLLFNYNGYGSPFFLIKISAIILLSFTFFYLGKHWYNGDYQQQQQKQLIFFNNHQSNHSISLSPNTNIIFHDNDADADVDVDLSSFIIPVLNSPSPSPSIDQTEPFDPPLSLPLPLSPPPVSIDRFGIVDENGTMATDFEVGEFDSDLVEDWENGNVTEQVKDTKSSRVRVKKFGLCSTSMKEYIPCLDNVDEIKKLKSTEKGEKFERHCPTEGKRLNCLVPPPKGYRPPIPWPKSRSEEDRIGLRRIRINLNFLEEVHNLYMERTSTLIRFLRFGVHTRVALDVGCGVASFGAFLLSRNVITLSIAPKDVHENQIQFALERGVPAMVAAFATHRLLYPSQAFDLIHCSRCRINWTRDDGVLLLEVNRMLRAGGYFAWAAQPVYKHEEALQEQWKEMEDLTNRLCWELVSKEGYIAIWRKPLNNICYNHRDAGTKPPLCDLDDEPDNVWYVGLKSCISRLPENGYGANVTTWPSRLYNPPDRLKSIQIDAYLARRELFKAESKYWKEILTRYIRVYRWKKLKFRNVMDMRAGFGGFAAALVDLQIDCWVMNVVPISGHNTLPVIFDRGLIGVMHDWCEPFDTYPRTYDLLHAAGLLSVERKRCNISTIMLEMDRILRPGGRAYIRDSVAIIDETQEIANAMGWRTTLRDTEEGPHASYKVLMCEKRLLRA